MFVGKLSHLEFTQTLTPKLKEIISTVKNKLSSPIDDGTYKLDGDNVFFIVVNDHTQLQEIRRAECHRRYLDVQILLEGHETFGYSVEPFVALDDDLLDEKDLAFSTQLKKEHYADLSAGDFIIFAANQPHKPLIATNRKPMPVRKAIIKIDKDVLN